MAQVGWLVNGEEWLHEELMAYAATYPDDFDWTPEMLDGMFRHKERDFLSPTTFSGCPRQVVLKRLLDYYVEVEKAWAAYRGTMAHLMFENGRNEPDSVIEERFTIEMEIDGEAVEVKGKPDKLVPEGDGTWLLIDYKTVGEIQTAPKKSWIAQLSCYRYLLHHCGIEVGRARLQQVSMGAPKVMPLTDKLWSLQRTERYIVAQVRRFKGPVLDIDSYNFDNLPPPLDFTLDDNSWLCIARNGRRAWCEVQEECFRLMAEGR